MKVDILGQPDQCALISFRGLRFLYDFAINFEDLLYFTPPQPFHPTTNVNNPKNGKTPRKEHQAKVVVQKLGHHVYVKEQQLLYAAPPLHCSSEEEDDDLSDVDFVLISSHQHALALPYLTEHTNFCGRILITEPCAHLARIAMLDLIHHHRETGQHVERPPLSLINAIRMGGEEFQGLADRATHSWQELYSPSDVEACFHKMNCLSYNQPVVVGDNMTVTAVSSGGCIGGANWVVESCDQKIVLVSDSSSAVTRHPQKLAVEPLLQADCVFLKGLSVQAKSLESSMQELLSSVAQTLQAGGNVFIPCDPTGLLLDLMDHLHSFFVGNNIDNKICVVSSCSSYVVSYANILPEWLSDSKQERSFMPEDPFVFARATPSGLVQHFSDLPHLLGSKKVREPFVCLASHPSIRLGDSVDLLRMWSRSASTGFSSANPNNALIMVDARFPPSQTLAPLEDTNFRIIHVPIDCRITASEADQLLWKIKPSFVVAPHTHDPADASVPIKHRLAYSGGTIIFTRYMSRCEVTLNGSFEEAVLDAETARRMELKAARIGRNGLLAARVSGATHRTDASRIVDSADSRGWKRRKLIGAMPSTEQLVLALGNAGLYPSRIYTEENDRHNNTNGTVVIQLSSLEASIRLSNTETKIIAKDNATREAVKRCIVQQCASV